MLMVNQLTGFGVTGEKAYPELGAFHLGGYYVGNVIVSATTYAVLLAPKSTGQSPTKLQWKTSQTSSSGADSLVDGSQNTIDINNSSHPAAQWAAALSIDGYSDWYLPAKDELNLVWTNRTSLPIGETNDTDDYYWSSTESSSTQAWAQIFSNGTQIQGAKNVSAGIYARAVRRIVA
jgi:hypothetical protein